MDPSPSTLRKFAGGALRDYSASPRISSYDWVRKTGQVIRAIRFQTGLEIRGLATPRVYGQENITHLAGVLILDDTNRFWLVDCSLIKMRKSQRPRIGIFRKIGKRLHWLAGPVLVCVGLSACRASDVVVIQKNNRHQADEEAIRRVAEFYGLNILTVDAGKPDAHALEMTMLTSPRTLAVLISQDSLPGLDRKGLQSALRRRNSSPIPILIFGIEPGPKVSELRLWSNATVLNCTPVIEQHRPKTLEVGSVDALTKALAGLKLPAVATPACRIQFDRTPTTQNLLLTSDDDTTNDAAVLVRSHTSAGDVFFVPRMNLFDSSWIGKLTGLSKSFSWFAPYILFLSNAAEDYGWHSPGHYANLTIDDAWLIEPYGYLDYKALLVEMEEHNFHTTAAFVPWNFDRSRPEVVALFKSHPDRYSVCVHGNNHAHREFGEYLTNHLADQIADIKQGIARMERFTSLTQIPYDRFMVFPHAVAPEPTFAALRTYGFLGTANSSNVPLGEPFPRDPMFFLRPYTTDYASLLSLYRYAAAGEVPRVDVAIQAFLGNPILFYDHSSLFSAGITAFDSHADFVNHIQPDTQWTTLGEIARHSYLLRTRTGGGIDVLMLSSEMKLENSADTEQVFYVRRNDNPGLGGTLTVDGSSVHSDSSFEERIVIPAHESRLLRMTYANDLNLAREEVKTRNLYVYTLRMISDIRDLYFSKSSLGESFVRSYYRYRWDSAELFLERNWWMIIVFVIVGFGGSRYHRSRAPKHTSQGARS